MAISLYLIFFALISTRIINLLIYSFFYFQPYNVLQTKSIWNVVHHAVQFVDQKEPLQFVKLVASMAVIVQKICLYQMAFVFQRLNVHATIMVKNMLMEFLFQWPNAKHGNEKADINHFLFYYKLLYTLLVIFYIHRNIYALKNYILQFILLHLKQLHINLSFKKTSK